MIDTRRRSEQGQGVDLVAACWAMRHRLGGQVSRHRQPADGRRNPEERKLLPALVAHVAAMQRAYMHAGFKDRSNGHQTVPPLPDLRSASSYSARTVSIVVLAYTFDVVARSACPMASDIVDMRTPFANSIMAYPWRNACGL